MQSTLDDEEKVERYSGAAPITRVRWGRRWRREQGRRPRRSKEWDEVQGHLPLQLHSGLLSLRSTNDSRAAVSEEKPREGQNTKRKKNEKATEENGGEQPSSPVQADVQWSDLYFLYHCVWHRDRTHASNWIFLLCGKCCLVLNRKSRIQLLEIHRCLVHHWYACLYRSIHYQLWE